MAEIEWGKIAIEAGVSLVSGVAGAIGWIWNKGRHSAKSEQAVKDDYDGKIVALRHEVTNEMSSFEKSTNLAREVMIDQFQETFSGIRRQIDEHRFYTEKDFMKKEDFRDFREEYREDMRDLKASIASIPRTQ